MGFKHILKKKKTSEIQEKTNLNGMCSDFFCLTEWAGGLGMLLLITSYSKSLFVPGKHFFLIAEKVNMIPIGSTNKSYIHYKERLK